MRPSIFVLSLTSERSDNFVNSANFVYFVYSANFVYFVNYVYL